MAENLGNKASIDVFIYNYDLTQFEEIIDNHITTYDYYVILPHFKNESEDVVEAIRKIPKEKVLLVDRNLPALKDYPLFTRNKKDIQSRWKGIEEIRKYRKINLVFPQNQYYSKHILRGFQIFCQINQFDFSVIDQLSESDVVSGEAFVLITDDDLYRMIKIAKGRNWKLGKDIGIVAYNDTPVKEILEDGISTISTNHNEIGRLAAEMILKKTFSRIKSPFAFIQRKSL